MGIIICPECGGKVSTTLGKCPHCGYKIKDTIKCPDCEEEINIGSNSCPICGHQFVSTNFNSKAEILGLSCPGCGSNDSKKIDSDTYVCNACGTKFRPEKGSQIIINNVVNSKGKTLTDCAIPTNTSLVDKTIDEKDFLRKVFEKLNNDSTPADIFDASFKDIEIDYIDICEAKGHQELDYYRSIGYDKDEYYTDYKYEYQDGNRISVPVTKTRTITDWDPDNGHVSAISSNKVIISNDYSHYDEKIFDSIDNIDSSNYQIIGSEYRTIDNNELEFLRNSLIRNSYYENVKQIGDHIKDVKYSGDSKFTDLKLYSLPRYRFKFEYKNKNYELASMAIGKLNLYYLTDNDFPPLNMEEEFNKNIKPDKNKVDTYNSLLATCIILALLSLIALFITFYKDSVVGIIISIIFIILFGVLAVFIYKKAHDLSKSIKERTDVFNDKKINMKKDGYKNIKQKYDL